MKIKSLLFAVLFSLSLIFGINFSSQTEIFSGVPVVDIECEHYWTIEEIGDEWFLVERDCNDRIISMIPIDEE